MDSYPALYGPTGYGLHDGEAVVRTPHAVKTLQGDCEAIVDLLAAMDGETAAGELVAGVTETTEEHVDLLYDHGLAYNAAAIPTGLRETNNGRLLEPALAALPPARHHEVPDRLDSSTVAVFGQREPISPVIARLRVAGVTVTDEANGASDGTTEPPDVVVLSEQLERSAAWQDANEQWVDAGSTLVATRLTARGWRLGPVLTAAAPACLHCVYRREDANGVGGQLFTGRGGEPPHARAYVDTVTELLFGTLLRQVPRSLDEQFVVHDHYDQTTETPRVFGLPHCEVCNV